MSERATTDTPTTPRLQRSLRPLHVWALALGCIIGWGSFIMPGTVFLPQAGVAGTAIAFALATVMMLAIAFNYSYMIERYPQAGGEFAYVSRLFGRRAAFGCSWLLGLCYLALVAQNATALAVVARSLFGGVLKTGYLYTIAGYDIYAAELALALGALAVFALLNVRGVRLAGVFQTVLVLAIVGGVLAVCSCALAAPGAPLAHIEPAFSPHTAPAAGVLAVLAIAPFAFVGFDTIPQAAEEYGFAPGRARVLIVVALLFGALLYLALNTLAASAVPEGYADWPAYVADAPSLDGVASLPTFHAAWQLMGPAGVFLLGAAASGAILSGIVGFYLASSRLLFAMGRDGCLPAWFAQVHPRWKTPRNAIVFVMLAASIAPFFGRTVLGWLVDMSALGAAVAYGATSLAALHSARTKEPGTAQRGIVVTGVAGLVFSVAFCVLLLVPIPGLQASLGPQGYLCLAVWVALGVVFYQTTKGNAPAPDPLHGDEGGAHG